MKDNKLLIIILACAILTFFVYMQKSKKSATAKKTNKSTKKTTSQPIDEPQVDETQEVETHTLEELYDPSYSMTETNGITMQPDSYGVTAGYSFDENTMQHFGISESRMREIIKYVDRFANDLSGAPGPFMPEFYADFFSKLKPEEARFAKHVVKCKGYVLNDKDGNSYLLEGFEDVFTDPLQRDRENVEVLRESFAKAKLI